MKRNKIIIIGICGGSGSGKSTLSNLLVKELQDRLYIKILSQDSYYMDRSHVAIELREKINYDHPNAVDFNLLFTHLITLKNRKYVNVPVYDFSTHSRQSEFVKYDPPDILLLEGILIFAIPHILNILDYKIFLDAPLEIMLKRRLQRDITTRNREKCSILDQFERDVKPMFYQFVLPSKRFADLIIDTTQDSIELAGILKNRILDYTKND